MFDIKQYLGTFITLISMLVAFAVGWGTLNTKVEANTKKLDGAVYQNEFRAVLQGQEKMNESLNKRLDKLDSKIDRLLEKR